MFPNYQLPESFAPAIWTWVRSCIRVVLSAWPLVRYSRISGRHRGSRDGLHYSMHMLTPRR
jgi:hypothetical protein